MISADVAIVGYGPVGQAMAAYLGSAGVSVAVFERDRYVFERARTGGADDETMRMFQHLGLTDAIIRGARIPGDMRFLNADGQVLMSWGAGEWGPNGYGRMYMWHQPEVDEIVRAYVGTLDNVRVRLEHTVEVVTQSKEMVYLTATDRRSGGTVECEARYLVGCDGARSVVRPVVGGAFEPLAPDEDWLVVDLTLNREVDLPEESCHYCDPRRPTTFIRNVGNRRRWEFMALPGESSEEMATPPKVWELLGPWLKPDDAKIYRAVAYTFHALLASRWRNGRVLIAGDAAHLMPPFLGQGLCSGFRDVRNLSWKLAAVLNGTAPDGLLDTYQSERAPHVRAFTDMSVRFGSVIQTLDPVAAAARDAGMLAQTETAQTPTPQLGPGLLPSSAEPPLGLLFAQPRLADGRLLDDASGERFTILGLPSLIDSVAQPLREQWVRDDLAVIADASPETTRALNDVEATAALIRPDRYLLATAQSAADLEKATQLLPRTRA